MKPLLGRIKELLPSLDPQERANLRSLIIATTPHTPPKFSTDERYFAKTIITAMRNNNVRIDNEEKTLWNLDAKDIIAIRAAYDAVERYLFQNFPLVGGVRKQSVITTLINSACDYIRHGTEEACDYSRDAYRRLMEIKKLVLSCEYMDADMEEKVLDLCNITPPPHGTLSLTSVARVLKHPDRVIDAAFPGYEQAGLLDLIVPKR